MGDSATADNYRQVAKDIEPTLLNHYNGQYLTETEGRPMDSAVINGIALSFEFLSLLLLFKRKKLKTSFVFSQTGI